MGIVLFIIINTLSVAGREAASMEKEGGMRTRYSLLIHSLLNTHPSMRILDSFGTFVILGFVQSGVTTKIIISQVLGILKVEYISESNLFGRHKLKWEYDSVLDLYNFAEKIKKDIKEFEINFVRKRLEY